MFDSDTPSEDRVKNKIDDLIDSAEYSAEQGKDRQVETLLNAAKNEAKVNGGMKIPGMGLVRSELRDKARRNSYKLVNSWKGYIEDHLDKIEKVAEEVPWNFGELDARCKDLTGVLKTNRDGSIEIVGMDLIQSELREKAVRKTIDWVFEKGARRSGYRTIDEVREALQYAKENGISIDIDKEIKPRCEKAAIDEVEFAKKEILEDEKLGLVSMHVEEAERLFKFAGKRMDEKTRKELYAGMAKNGVKMLESNTVPGFIVVDLFKNISRYAKIGGVEVPRELAVRIYNARVEGGLRKFEEEAKKVGAFLDSVINEPECPKEIKEKLEKNYAGLLKK